MSDPSPSEEFDLAISTLAEAMAAGIVKPSQVAARVAEIMKDFGKPKGLVEAELKWAHKVAQAKAKPADDKEGKHKTFAPADLRQVIRFVLQENFAGSDGWTTRVDVNPRTGAIAATAANVATILQNWPTLQGVFARDEWAGQIVLRKTPPWRDDTEWKTREIGDMDIVNLQVWLQRQAMPTVGPDAVWGGIQTVADANRFDPAVEWAKSLEATWDGVPRVNEMAGTVFKIQPGPARTLAGRILRWWMISAFQRIVEPGCKADHAMVLVGPQGCGKSTFMRELTPREEWFSDQLDSESRNPRDELLKLQGVMLVEIAEFDKFRGKDAAGLKAFISTQKDTYRAPYGRVVETKPRRCVFGGTTNVSDFLSDFTGGRRFWPITVTEKIDVEWVTANRDQLWAEIEEAMHNGEVSYPTPDDEAAIEALSAAQALARESDPWEEAIAGWIEGEWDTTTNGVRQKTSDDAIPLPVERQQGVYIADVLTHALGVPTAQTNGGHARRVRACLSTMGFTKGERHWLKGYRWTPLTAWKEPE